MIHPNTHTPAFKEARKAQWLVLLALWVGSMTGACATTTTERLNLPPLQTVSKVDLSRYTGTWFEIASYPQSFQEGCTGTTATYTLRDSGEIGVVNRCRKGSLSGEEDSAEGRARVVDTTTNAKLEVTFFWPFWGDYWIIDLGEDYQYAVVGHPSRDYLWIFSRTPTMEDSVYQSILRGLKAKGYPLDRLQKTLQPKTAPTPALATTETTRK
jgi:apolipoprotein D and lipocalin family protein